MMNTTFEKLIAKQANPLCGWTKFGILILFPSFLYKHELLAVVLFIILLIAAVLCFPKPKASQKIDFMYHVMRGVYLEFKGEATHYSEFWKKVLGGTFRKIMTVSLYIIFFVFSAFLLWNDHLEIGSLLYYIGVSFVLSALTDYADISKITPNSESWDQLML